MGIQINGQTDRISAVDGSFGIQDLAELNISGIVTAASANFTGNVSIGGTLTYQDVTNIDSVGIITARAGVKVPDNQKVFLGTGNDLEIYHDGSNARIKNTTGQLWLQSDNGIRFVDSDVNESTARFTDNGAVELYYDGTKKFETTTTGATITNDLVLNHASGDKAIRWATGGTNKWSLYHNNSAGALVAYDNANNAERLRIDSAGKSTFYGAVETNGSSNAFLLAGASSTPTIGAGIHKPADDTLAIVIASAERMRISASGLSINKNAAADTELEIVQSADPTIRLHDTRNASYKADFLMAGSGPLIRTNNTTVSDRTLTVQKGTIDHLVIEGNGAVRKPKSPSFAAWLSSGNINAANYNNVIIFNNEWFDNSNSYNASNGRFTAPVAGKYYFGVQIYAGFDFNGVRVLHSKFQKNGSDFATADMFGGSSNHGGTYYHPTGCGHILIDLAVNDYVAFNSGGFSASGTGNALIYSQQGTRFFGYLVG